MFLSCDPFNIQSHKNLCTTVLSTPRYGQCPKCSKSTLWYNHTLHSDIKVSKVQQIYPDPIENSLQQKFTTTEVLLKHK